MVSISPALRTFNKDQNSWSSIPAGFIFPAQLWEGFLMSSALSKIHEPKRKMKLGRAEATAGYSASECYGVGYMSIKKRD